MSRKYSGVWTQLKKQRICTISVHPLLFSRVIKGVKKEKYNDMAFKVANDLDSCVLIINKNPENHTIEFKLKQRTGISDLVVV